MFRMLTLLTARGSSYRPGNHESNLECGDLSPLCSLTTKTFGRKAATSRRTPHRTSVKGRLIHVVGQGQLAQYRASLSVTCETFLFSAKRRRMNAPAASGRLDGMLYVQHLVIEDVLDHHGRNVGAIERSVEHDGMMGDIVM